MPRIRRKGKKNIPKIILGGLSPGVFPLPSVLSRRGVLATASRRASFRPSHRAPSWPGLFHLWHVFCFLAGGNLISLTALPITSAGRFYHLGPASIQKSPVVTSTGFPEPSYFSLAFWRQFASPLSISASCEILTATSAPVSESLARHLARSRVSSTRSPIIKVMLASQCLPLSI